MINAVERNVSSVYLVFHSVFTAVLCTDLKMVAKEGKFDHWPVYPTVNQCQSGKS